jgi:hypothetical protein
VRQPVVVESLRGEAEVAVHDRGLGLRDDHGQAGPAGLVLEDRQDAADVDLGWMSGLPDGAFSNQITQFG